MKLTQLIALVCLACTPEPKVPPPAEVEHRDEPEHDAPPSQVKLSPEVIEAAKLRWAPVRREALEGVLELPGEIAADPDRTARISVPVDGRLARIDLREGDRVKKGQVLALLEVIELPERLAAAKALSARSKAARANADRLAALAQKGLAGVQEADSARAEAEALEAEAKGESDRLGALGAERAGVLEVRAPIGGVVIERHAVLGDRIGPERPIGTIVDLDRLWFLGRVFEQDLAAVKLGERAEVALNAFPDRRFEGVVEYVAEQIDPVARTVVARIRIDNPDRDLRIGLFGAAQVAIGRPLEPALVVPRTAITDFPDRPVVFVRQADGDFVRHEIVVGRAALGKVEVLSGLREGELVVVEGAFTLKSASLKATFGEED